MVRVDLITGFLGAGKTTFIREYARYFMRKGQNIGILENDYGAVNVDMLLLNELCEGPDGDLCELEMVAGACDKDCHMRRFRTKLIAMSMCGYDRVLIEPSGLFDVDEFFDVIRDEVLENRYEIGNVIAVVDARLENEMSEEADFYLASQIANAGCVVLSRTQLASAEQIADTKNHVLAAAVAAKVRRNPEEISGMIFEKDWSLMDDADFARIASSGYDMCSYVKLIAGKEESFQTLYFMELPFTGESVRDKAAKLLADRTAGNVFRLKGFFKEDDVWYQVNATKRETEISEIQTGQEVLIVIGENLDKERIREIMEKL